MDPNACLEAFCDALKHDDPDTAQSCGEDLLLWLGAEGFPPTVTVQQLRTMVSNLLMYVDITGLSGKVPD